MKDTHSFILISEFDVVLEQSMVLDHGYFTHLSICHTGNTVRIEEVIFFNGAEITSKNHVYSSDFSKGIAAYFYGLFQRLTETGVIIYNHSNSIFHLVSEPVLKSGLPCVVWLKDEASCDFNWKQQHFVANAVARFSFSETVKKKWQSKVVHDCDVLALDEFEDLLSRSWNTRIANSVTFSKSEQSRSVLLISYYAEPAQTVAAHRIAYWHEQLPLIAAENDEDLTVTLLTAINSYQQRPNVLHIPDFANVTDAKNETHGLAAELQHASVNYFSVYWADQIKNYFLEHQELKFDNVILSGNPFYYFDLGSFFKESWGANIILDFRDPFANNPRFTYSNEHKEIVTQLEQRFIQNADYAVSVNHFCLDLLNLDQPQKGKVIANGYDERVVDSIEAIRTASDNPDICFVYTGSFYADRNPKPFLQELDESKHRLVHIGRSTAADQDLDQYPALIRYGLMPYSEVIGHCKSMTAGVIFTSGAPFEQTTKIFDYIAADLDLIIITDGDIKTGELHRLTKEMTSVYWVKNVSSEIKQFLAQYKPSRNIRSNRAKFSRKYQTEQLYKLLR